jgi:hypothetical protein
MEIGLILFFWSLAGAWVWLNVIWRAGGNARYAWLTILVTLFGGPFIWLIMLFVTVNQVQSVFVGTSEPQKPVQEPPRVPRHGRWFVPSKTSRN